MKRTLILLLILWMLGCSAAMANQVNTYATVNADNVNVRQKPGGKTKEQLDRGECVYILENKQQDGKTWCRVIIIDPRGQHNRSGWMSGEYLTDFHDGYRDVVKAAVGLEQIALLHRDGTVSVTGFHPAHMEGAEAWRDVEQIAMGRYHLIALTKYGRVRSCSTSAGWKAAEAWQDIREVWANPAEDFSIGIDKYGQTVNDWNNPDHREFPSWPQAIQRYYSDKINVYLDAAGVLHVEKAWGADPVSGELTQADGLSGVRQFAAAETAIVCLMTDGTVRCFTEDRTSGIRDAAEWMGIRKIVMGEGNFALGLKENGTAVFAGTLDSRNVNFARESKDLPVSLSDQLAAWKDLADIAAGPFLIVGVHTDGTVDMLGAYRFE